MDFQNYELYIQQLLSSDKGVDILYGLPRSGKTTLVSQTIHDLTEIGMEVDLLRQGEFDSNIFESDYIDDFSEDITNFFLYNDSNDLLIIDSAKALLYEGTKLRKGGISNEVVNTLTKLNRSISALGKRVLLTFSPSSASYESIIEIATMLSSCTERFYCLNFNRELLVDMFSARKSIYEVMNHIKI